MVYDDPPTGRQMQLASKDGIVPVGGHLHSVPDTSRRRVLVVQHRAAEIRIFEERGQDCHRSEGMPERADRARPVLEEKPVGCLRICRP
ncbi:hypothetical protein [Poseidonocella sp. HB161398]|uniref:hypothetical protein n=1 Tax=Poseidonocella sp. HB161398 TaxID=2320855 RepID=UPI0014867F81|nr:hypothetical protein [Poseidonocella sp. HB161398]